jgi:hypothetical protein
LRKQTTKAEGFAPQGKREEQDLSSSLLLNSAEKTEPSGDVVLVECGAKNKAAN